MRYMMCLLVVCCMCFCGCEQLRGKKGDDGVKGGQGIAGLNGLSGVSGISGATGISGKTGISGSTGSSGLSGISGKSGVSGFTGMSGSTGNDAIIETKTYTGTPNAQFFSISIPEYKNIETMSIECYAKHYGTGYTAYYKLPYSHSNFTSHEVSYSNLPNSAGTYVHFSSYKSNGQAESTALYDSYWTSQFDYLIVLKSFRTASACISYKLNQMESHSPNRLDWNPYDTLIYGREIVK